MRNRLTLLFVSLATASVLLVAACSQPSNGAGPFTPTAASPSLLKQGAGATVVAHSFTSGAAVEMTYDPNGVVAPPNGAWGIVPGTLHAVLARSGLRPTRRRPAFGSR